MIPIKLQIKNFLSYGSELQEINFENYNLICLSGKNGHGKSALLDAMTWAVWGEARKTIGIAKPDHGLLRLGQRHMIVIFDFEFNKNKYRVRREFTFAYGKPYAYLEFGMFEDQEKVIPLTDKTIRATQNKIESMIGLNFDSFTNSAFLRQGSSNEFSKKSPKDRKEILANILGLDKYESIRKIALENIKNYQQEKDGYNKVCEHIEKELSGYDDILNNIEQIKNEFERVLNEENNLESKKKILDQEKKILNDKIQENDRLNIHLKKIEEEKNKRAQIVLDLYRKWKKQHAQIINLPDQKKIEEEKNLIINKISILQKNFEEKLELKELNIKLKEQEQLLFNEINNKKNNLIQTNKIDLEKLFNKKNIVEEKLKNLEKIQKNFLLENKNVKNEIGKLNNSVIKINDEKFLESEKLFEKRKNFYQKYIATGNLLKNELNTLNQKKLLIFDEKNPSCPLCEQNLSASRKKFLKQEFFKQERFLNHRLKRISKLLIELKEKLIIQNDDIEKQKKQIGQNKIINLKITDLSKIEEKNLLQLNQLNKEENEFLIDLKVLHEAIDHKNNEIKKLDLIDYFDIPEYKKLISSIDENNKKINAIEYDSEKQKKFNERLEILNSNLEIYLNEKKIIQEQNQLKNEIHQFFTQIKDLKKEIKNFTEKLFDFKDIEIDSKNLLAKEQEIINSINFLIKQKEELLLKNGSFANQKLKLEQLKEELVQQKQKIVEFEKAIDDYKTIATALSKDGIQAILIEEAIPEIENECNDLLAKLTDNQSQIIIESLRDLKKGGTKETLDIKISDGSGIRPYEMFSGGEAFRIDFALRIAISKLLARRAGTSLQTLIIDEGFGSQDEEGLANIMESIYKIQDDFAKIIIVSHLPTMKDQFPVHFVVEKSPAGSKVKVIEQG